ncbi:MAG TPA: hypothetical protein VMU42_16100, partial [Candidatus Sulfotelmatobacter sp.]|nr:hypothetical protein [Candidatus Sulfotelmatobacter sp.]
GQPAEAEARAGDVGSAAAGVEEDDEDIVHPGERHLNQHMAAERARDESAAGDGEERRRRRRGRRGGKRRRRDGEGGYGAGAEGQEAAPGHEAPGHEAPGHDDQPHDAAAERMHRPDDEPHAEATSHAMEPAYEPPAVPPMAPAERAPLAPSFEAEAAGVAVAPQPSEPAPVAEAVPEGPPKRGWWRRRSS